MESARGCNHVSIKSCGEGRSRGSSGSISDGEGVEDVDNVRDRGVGGGNEETQVCSDKRRKGMRYENNSVGDEKGVSHGDWKHEGCRCENCAIGGLIPSSWVRLSSTAKL